MTVIPGITPQMTTTPSITLEPTAIPTTVSCEENSGTVKQVEFQSTLLGKEFQSLIFFPECYSTEIGKSYPVLYLLHGQTFNDDQWVRLGAKEAADSLIKIGARVPFLMVMPFDEDNLLPTVESKFSQVIVDELIPWVDEHYPTCSQKSCRAIAGISRGAGWAIRLGLSHPELFESAAAHSLPSFIGDDKQIPVWLKGLEPSDLPRIWMDSGRSDIFLPQAEEFEAALTNNQVPHEFYIYSGYHDEQYWRSHMEEYISWSTLSWK